MKGQWGRLYRRVSLRGLGRLGEPQEARRVPAAQWGRPGLKKTGEGESERSESER